VQPRFDPLWIISHEHLDRFQEIATLVSFEASSDWKSRMDTAGERTPILGVIDKPIFMCIAASIGFVEHRQLHQPVAVLVTKAGCVY